MIVSRRAPSSFDASPYRAMDSFQTEFHFVFQKKSWTWSWIRSRAWSLDLDQVLDLVLDKSRTESGIWSWTWPRTEDLVLDLVPGRQN